MMEKVCALTFDDGPSEHTVNILNSLEKYGAAATFFVLGKYVEAGSETIKRAFDMGCEIANHSWNHPHMMESSEDEIRKELSDTTAAIKNIIGEEPKIFRPPYGEVNDSLKAVCAALGFPLIIWSLDPLDWESKCEVRVYSKIAANIHDRAIVLSHDVYDSTAKATERVIPELLRRGYKLVTVSELARLSGLTLEAGKIYNNC